MSAAGVTSTVPVAASGPAAASKNLELSLYVGAAHDGRFCNNGWLMELPDPMTRVSWESPLLMSPKTAAANNLSNDDVVLVKTAAQPNGLEAVVYALPGHPDDCASLALGYGRPKIGSVANGDGNDVVIWTDESRSEERMRFSYPRQNEAPFLCIADFFRPIESGEVDYAAFHIVTMGAKVSDAAAELFAKNEYQKYLVVHGLGVEMAEALAEFWHHRIRSEWGFEIGRAHV